MKIIFSPKCLEYGGMHIEGPGRVRSAYEILANKGYEFLEPEPASDKDILRVHTRQYLERLKEGFVGDVDTPAYENIYEYARLSAGGAILAAREKGFSLMRPPGHHAGRNGRALDAPTLGFCYLNNVAIAVSSLGLQTLIVDIDGHHCNGTQEIFYGNERVSVVSLHRYPLYPLTGVRSEGNCINIPLPADCGEKMYLHALKKALSQVDKDSVELVAVSAGFDAHEGDLASLGLTEKTYFNIGRMLASIGKPTFFVLEGGYDGEKLGRDIDQLIKGFET